MSRPLGALIVVLSTICDLLLPDAHLRSIIRRLAELPKTSKSGCGAVSKKLETFESHVSEIKPTNKPASESLRWLIHRCETPVLSRLGAPNSFVAATFVRSFIFMLAPNDKSGTPRELFPATSAPE